MAIFSSSVIWATSRPARWSGESRAFIHGRGWAAAGRPGEEAIAMPGADASDPTASARPPTTLTHLTFMPAPSLAATAPRTLMGDRGEGTGPVLTRIDRPFPFGPHDGFLTLCDRTATAAPGSAGFLEQGAHPARRPGRGASHRVLGQQLGGPQGVLTAAPPAGRRQERDR